MIDALNFRGETERRVRLLAAAADSEELRAVLTEQWRRDPVRFVGDCLWTYDPRPRTWRHRPFMPWPAQADLVHLLAGTAPHSRDSSGAKRPVALKKSRDQAGSVIASAVTLWGWLFHAEDHGLMTRAGYQLDGSGYNSLFGKIDYAINRLPAWLVPWRGTRAGAKARAKRPPIWIHPETGAVIMGATTVDGGWRGPRMGEIWVDEAAWVPGMEAILTSIMGATDSPRLISSVAGKGNTFYRVEMGEAFGVTDAGTPGDGWVRALLHFRDDPRKDAGWVERKRSTTTPETFAQEYNCDYAASAPGRIWPEFRAKLHVLQPAEWRRILRRADEEGWEILEGWDYGVMSLTAAVWALYDPRGDVLYLADYGVWRERRIDEIADDVGVYGWACSANPDGIMPARRVGDPAGKNRDSMLTSPVKNLAKYGIRIEPQRIKNGDSLRDIIRLKIAQNRVILAPKCATRKVKSLPSLSESIEQYRRAKTDGPDRKPRKDDFSHAADALQYIAAALWQPEGEIEMLWQN